jgi:oligoendopeptidase F
VYQYATGIAAAQALAARILAGEAGSVEAYLAFLAKGGSEYPIEALRQAGVDMTSSAPVEAAFDNLEAMVDDLERLL